MAKVKLRVCPECGKEFMGNLQHCSDECRHAYHTRAARESYRKKHSVEENNTRNRWRGCNEDCEHCPYPDCLKPEGMF